MSFKRKILLYSLLMTLTIAITTAFCIFEIQDETNTEILSPTKTHQTSLYLTAHQENIGNEASYYFFSNIFIPSFATNCTNSEVKSFSKLTSPYCHSSNIKDPNGPYKPIMTHSYGISFIIKDISSRLCRWLI